MALKKIQRRTPGNRVVTHLKNKKTAKHKCGLCRGLLHGTPRDTKAEIGKISHRKRRPERPFGGQLCSKCSRTAQKTRAQLEGGIIKKEDVPISLRSYVNGS